MIVDRFYIPGRGHTPLSNFWAGSPFLAPDYNGLWRDVDQYNDDPVWLTTEHYYQAAKASDWRGIETVLNCSTPGKAKLAGNALDLRSDWEEIKYDVMRTALQYKFVLGSFQTDYLLSTGDALLVEGNTWGDRVWGVCDGVGANWLGILLMARRCELRHELEYVKYRTEQEALTL